MFDIKESMERDNKAEQAMGWDMILFPTPAFRRILIAGVGIAIAQQVVGIDAIQYFLVIIIEEAGVGSKAWQTVILIFMGLFKLIIIFLAGRLFDRKGRRPLFFMSLVGEPLIMFPSLVTLTELFTVV